ncbi:hypothetical protein LMH87_001244 [Akanthomyces muscarius]|uniref:chitinase n=1 Tax=Akanthomyces muscarius TaxID=2231603 RepID=A0A9W8QIZ9_AKAMU|nr:hypothetical protein LMH87_001244 [Akanthomyces muscarius]KAJ4156030.1 hypothetical protein LMH87_001244 [Akanthomyces muscarius]
MRPVNGSAVLAALAFASLSTALTESYSGDYPDNCPGLCERLGPDPSKWTQLHRLDELSSCNQSVIFDLNVHNSVDDPNTVLTIRACVSTGNESYDAHSKVLARDDSTSQDSSVQESLVISQGCGAKTVTSSLAPSVGGKLTMNSGKTPKAGDISDATQQLTSFMKKGSQCGRTILFAKSGSAIVGMHSGADVAKSSAPGLLDAFSKQIEQGGSSLQICSSKAAPSTFGVIATHFEDLAAAQAAVKSWNDGDCLDGASAASTMSVDMLVSLASGNATAESNTTMSSNSTIVRRTLDVLPRAECKTEQCRGVGDGCPAIAGRCGISVKDLQKYNGGADDFCNKLMPKQHVCCGPGTLPDFKPKPQPDGTCFTYKINPGDTCYAIADGNYLKQDDIDGFNKKTWGWVGCGNLQLGQLICLSSGDPPMPAPVEGNACGPQVPGTKKPPKGTDLSDLNPCPLNACCDVWGFCGTTDDFCTKTPADTGAPGTAKPNTNGCISNCGRKLVNNDKAPASYMKVGYYEAFGMKRDCMNMEVTSIDGDEYSHIHFAFATVTTSWGVDISDSKEQFDKFVKIDGKFKKILSFGGWDFSTKPETYQRFRDATKPENRGPFIDNLISFLGKNAIDGLDFDWEYPGAPDIPDVPPGGSDEGKNYLEFLKALKAKMPSGKSVSIALPASYWYLKQYPVDKMGDVVDYFIYMTYDLHGQWDVGNKHAIPGCEGGNCLRSHINKTETMDSLIMITKAGVEARKVVVGVSSYGRSFRMQDPSCSGPMCKYTGTRNQSEAYKGECTQTSGYISNAEMNEIIEYGGYSTVKSSYDKASDSNILMYGDGKAVDWVAYMDDDVKKSRQDWLKGLNFAGTSDWAVDLNEYTIDVGSDSGFKDFALSDLDDIECSGDLNPGNMGDLVDKADKLPARCTAMFALDILYGTLEDALQLFDVNSNGYDDKFGYYEEWVKEGINSKLDTFMDFRKDIKDAKGVKYCDCKYEYGNQKGQSSCAGMPHFWDANYYSYTVEYIIKDEKGFYDALSTETGIDKDWISWETTTDRSFCADPGDVPLRPGGGGVSPPCRHLTHTLVNYPRKGPDSKIKVGNPKKMIEASMPNITALQDSLLSSYASLSFGVYGDDAANASDTDPVVAYAMPVFQLQTAIESMKDIKDIGEKAREEKKKKLIMTILTFVFMAIPFVGEALGPIIGSAAAIARIALIISEVGNAALTVADIVEDPASAPFAILGLIAGVGGGTSKVTKEEALEKASSARGLMKADDLAKFPARFKELDGFVQKIVQKAKSPSCSIK